MDRRDAMRAVGLVAIPALLAGGAIPARAATGPLSEQAWRMQTLQYGTLSKHLCDILRARSATPLVREFADLELIEQKTAAIVLSQSTNPPAVPLTAKQMALLTELRTSPTVDQTFVALQIGGHQHLLQLQDGFFAQDSNLAHDAVHEALLLRSNVEQHLRLLRTILQGVT